MDDHCVQKLNYLMETRQGWGDREEKRIKKEHIQFPLRSDAGMVCLCLYLCKGKGKTINEGRGMFKLLYSLKGKKKKDTPMLNMGGEDVHHLPVRMKDGMCLPMEMGSTRPLCTRCALGKPRVFG